MLEVELGAEGCNFVLHRNITEITLILRNNICFGWSS